MSKIDKIIDKLKKKPGYEILQCISETGCYYLHSWNGKFFLKRKIDDRTVSMEQISEDVARFALTAKY